MLTVGLYEQVVNELIHSELERLHDKDVFVDRDNMDTVVSRKAVHKCRRMCPVESSRRNVESLCA